MSSRHPAEAFIDSPDRGYWWPRDWVVDDSRCREFRVLLSRQHACGFRAGKYRDVPIDRWRVQLGRGQPMRVFDDPDRVRLEVSGYLLRYHQQLAVDRIDAVLQALREVL